MQETANKVVLVTDRVQRAKDLLLSQFKDKENINLIVEALVEEVQEAEDALIPLRDLRMLETATGANLDNIGKRMKVQRTSDNDADYRTAIKIRILRKISRGTASDIKTIFKLLTQDPDPIITQSSPYVVELAAVLTCIGDSNSALTEIINLFPVNTGIRILSKPARPFGFLGNPNAYPFSSELMDPPQGQMCTLVYSDFGAATDPRFKGSADYIPPEKKPPVPTVLPYITYTTLEIGSVLTVNDGVWEGVTPITFLYQWFVDGSAVDGETTNTYTILAGDEDKPIYCRVIAQNTDGQYTTQTNSVILETAPVTGITPSLGIDATTYGAYNDYLGGSPIPTTTATVALTFGSDGVLTVERTDQADLTIDYLTTTGAGAGDNFEIYVTKTNGDNLTSPAQIDIWQPLTADRTFELSKSGDRYGFYQSSGTYVFTVRQVGTELSEDKTLTLIASVILETDL